MAVYSIWAKSVHLDETNEFSVIQHQGTSGPKEYVVEKKSHCNETSQNFESGDLVKFLNSVLRGFSHLSRLMCKLFEAQCSRLLNESDTSSVVGEQIV